jgi:hypothetical protein
MMRARIMLGVFVFAATSMLAGSTGALAAQVPNASAAATGLSGAYTARARGYDAIAWNPANLGLLANPDASFGFAALSASSGLAPVSLADVAQFSGKPLPAAQRDAWLETITAKGGERGRVDGGVTAAAFSTGPFALSISAAVAGSATLSPDAFEALMFGNAGRTGAPATLALAGSTLHMGAFTTAAGSYGLGFGDDENRFALGVTGKLVVGNALAIARDQGSTATSAGVAVDFPAVFSNRGSGIVAGSGAGLDVGVAWSRRGFSAGAAVQNFMNTFAWDETKLRARTAMAVFNETADTTDFSDRPYATAPASLRAMVANDKFKPVVSAGLAYAVNELVTVSIDARQRSDDGIAIGPKTQVAAGLEIRGTRRLRLRGGAAYVTDGWGASAGASLVLGRVDIGVGASLRRVHGGSEPGFTANLVSFR